ncbi:NAD(P)/FAD-dependent oxidoreductase [Aestuariirhabdus sp. LZHN29]|uniref:FAD/NAD(P)-dependent oxidoreductase n=1 Tax=Aestuariirhabdus sp. LZHN29 TaxID=3417462 RepID=UPI003CEC39F7
MNTTPYDLAVVGAGPAGMAAAIESARLGLKVVVIDEQPRPGGQIYREVGQPVLQDQQILGSDYYYGAGLVREFSTANIEVLHSATVWEIGARHLCLSADGNSRRISFARLLLATGAQERPVPFPGWTTPGVMTCGAAQIMLKSSGLAPSEPLVIVGSGPLLLLVACQLQRAGVSVAAVLDTTPTRHYAEALRELPGALRGWRYLLKGFKLLMELRSAGVKRLNGVHQLRAEAGHDGKLARVHFSHNGREQQLPCSTLLVHQGVVPNLQLTQALGAEHRWDELQQCWHPCLDSGGETSIGGVFVAGDSAGIGGALVAELQGKLAAIEIASRLRGVGKQNPGVEGRDREIRKLQQEIDQQLAIRPFLDRLYRPAEVFLRPADETLVCRCEEVTAGDIRRAAKNGCAGPNQAKAFSRAGMGPCQGRLCGLTVSQLMAEAHNTPVSEVGYYNIRSPIKPITLGELASMDTESEFVEQADA